MIEHVEPFWYWCEERHNIYTHRKNNTTPWTHDPILQKYRFCNVYRELDIVTIWIRENWRDPYKNDPNLWFAMCVARQINKVETLQRIGYPEGSLTRWITRTRKILKGMQEKGETIYGAAYILTGGGLSAKGLKKYEYTMDRILTPLSKKCKFFNQNVKFSLEGMQDELVQYDGFGKFIAYEVVSDLRWTRYYNGQDHNTWTNPGPGAMRGLGRLFYGDKKATIPRDRMLRLMQCLLVASRIKLPNMPNFEMREIEHSLCETDKYLRAKLGEGKPKQLYRMKP